MNFNTIKEVAIDPEGRLLIFPTSGNYAMIYREAAEVSWDQERRCLFSTQPREWTHLEWFKHIVTLAKDLTLSTQTKWTNIPEETRCQAEKWMTARETDAEGGS